MAHGTPRNEPLPDSYLREIGRVAVEWSKVEGALEAIIWTFLFVDYWNSSPWLREVEGRAVTTHVNVLLRVDMMLAISKAFASTTFAWRHKSLVEEVENIARKIRDLYPRRNKVVHSLWSPMGSMVLRQSYRARGDVSPLYDVMTLEDVKQVGDQIEALYTELDQFIPALSQEVFEQRRQQQSPDRR